MPLMFTVRESERERVVRVWVLLHLSYSLESEDSNDTSEALVDR